MVIQIGMERSMFHESVARRIGTASRSSHQKLISGALPSMDSYISDEHQVDNMYGTSSYSLIAARDVHLVGENHVPQDGKIPQQNIADFLGTSGGLGYGEAICGNHALLGNTKENARTHNQRGQWTLKEDRLLEKHVKKLGEKKWAMIAKSLPGRIGKQCRERWLNHLSPNIKRTAWTETEEKLIVALHRKHGTKWAKMAKRIPGRPENSIKNHWNATRRWLEAECRNKTVETTAAVRKATLSKVLEVYIRGLLDSGKLKKVAGAPASAAADPPVLDVDDDDDDDAASPASWQADQNPAVAEPSSGSNSSPDDQWWLRMLCGGTLPPPMMMMEAPEPTQDYVYATYDADGYVRYVHLQPTPGHSSAPVNQAAAAAAAAGYYNPPLGGQQICGHATYPAGSYYQEAGPSHRYINNGAGGDAGFVPAAAPGMAGMPFSANTPAGRNQRGGGAI